MPSDVLRFGVRPGQAVALLNGQVKRRPFRLLLVMLGLALAAWMVASGLPLDTNPHGHPTVSPKTALWAELGLQETAAGLVVLPALEPGDVLERHPVELLIEAAEAKARQQAAERPKTLDGAVAQYRALFAAEPPLGFDKWFAAFDPPPAILPKAREQIVPFLAIPGWTLRERLKRLDGVIQTISFDFRGGELAAVEGTQAPSGRARDLAQLLSPLATLVPDCKVYFNVDDLPRQIAHSRVWNASTHFGSRGQLWPERERAAFEDTQRGTHGYHWACGPDTPVGRLSRDVVLAPEADHTPRTKSFVWDHAKAMDYCYAPDLLDKHSLFLYGRPQPDVLTPIFSYCRSAHNADLFGVPMDAVRSEVPVVPWQEKTIPKLYWRGQGTGVSKSPPADWRATQRYRLYRFSHPSSEDAKTTQSVLTPSRDGHGWSPELRRTDSLIKELLDIEMVNGPIQCDQSAGVCDEMRAEVSYAGRSSPAEATKYQFVVDVDGNGWSSRFRRLLLGGSVVFKATVFPEWFSDALIPFYHYVPVQNSYADLFDLVAFFKARPELAQAIGDNGRRFALESWSWESMQAYHLLALLEYARALADDREAMTFQRP